MDLVKTSKPDQITLTRTISLIAVLSAVNVATNYVLLPLPNVKLMDTIVFLTGFTLGLKSGIAVATTTWLIYGVLNPLGLSVPTLIIVTIAEYIYAFSGYLLTKTRLNDRSYFERRLSLGVIGLLSTLTYDLITNAIVGLIFYGSAWIGLLTMNFPLPLGLIHEVSNTLLFALVMPILIRVMKQNIGDDYDEKKIMGPYVSKYFKNFHFMSIVSSVDMKSMDARMWSPWIRDMIPINRIKIIGKDHMAIIPTTSSFKRKNSHGFNPETHHRTVLAFGNAAKLTTPDPLVTITSLTSPSASGKLNTPLVNFPATSPQRVDFIAWFPPEGAPSGTANLSKVKAI